MDDFTRVQIDHEASLKASRKKRSVSCKRITRPPVLCMVPQEGRPVLPCSSRCASMPQILLNGTCRDMNAQLEEFTTNTLSSPQAILHCHFLDQSQGFCGDLWFSRCCSRLVFPVKPQSLAMPPQERLWLDE